MHSGGGHGVPRSPRGRTLRVLAALAVSALAVVGWVVASAHASGQVYVDWAGPPTCAGAGVTGRTAVGPGPGGDSARAEVLVEPALRCSFDVRVVNRGRYAVHLGRVSLDAPMLRSTPVRAESIAGRRPTTGVVEDTFEADLDRDLASGATRSFTVRMAYDPTSSVGCFHPTSTEEGTENGTETTAIDIRGLVTVHTRAWGIRHTRRDHRHLRLVRHGGANCG